MRNKKNQTKGIKVLNGSWLFRLNFCLSFIFFAFSAKVQAQSLGSGNCLNFNGSEHVTIGNAYSSMSLPVSISLWIKPNATGAQGIFYSSDVSPVNEGWWFQISPSGNLAINYGDGNGGNNSAFRRTGVNNIGSLAIGQWYHLAGVMRGVNDMDLYLNGVSLSVSYTGSGGPISTSGSNGLIGLNNQNGWDLNAQIDEMSIWDRALTATEIRNLMCAKLQGNEPGLRGYYRFDATTGNTLTDFSTNGNNGTLVNTPNWVASTAPVGDRSSWSYTATGTAIEFSPNMDSAVVSLNGTGTNGVHVYFVDALPTAMPVGPLVPPSVNHYLGTFAADNNRTVNLTYLLKPPLNGQNTSQLAWRAHNASSSWNLLSPFSNPIILSNRASPEQYIITTICPSYDVLPADTTGCDSLLIGVGQSYNNVVWNDNYLGNSRVISQSGQYYFSATDTSTGCPVSDTIIINLLNNTNLQLLPKDTTACDSVRLTVTGTFDNVVWNDLVNSKSRNFTNSGLYWYTATDSLTGCTNTDSVNINVINTNVISLLPNDTVVCDTLSIRLTQYSNVVWNDSYSGGTRIITQSGIYSIQATDSMTGCNIRDTMLVTVIGNSKDILTYKDTTGCDSLLISVGQSYNNVVWNDNYLGNSRVISQSGQYYFSATDTSTGCPVSDTIIINLLNNTNLQLLPKDTTACDSVRLMVTGTFDIVIWNDLVNSKSRNFTNSGLYWYTATDSLTGCTNTDSVNINVINTNVISLLPNDTVVCDTLSIRLTQYSNAVWNDSYSGGTRIITQSGIYSIQATDSMTGCDIRDTMLVTVIGNSKDILTYKDTTGCDSLLISVGQSYNNVVWNDNYLGNSRVISQSGQYYFSATDTITGCQLIDSIAITIFNTSRLGLFPQDTAVCDSLILSIGTRYSSVVWNGSDSTRTQTFKQNGLFWFDATDTLSGCAVHDSITVSILNPSNVNLFPNDTAVCDSLILTIDSTFVSIIWNDALNTNPRLFNQSGLYWLSVIDSSTGCLVHDTILITVTDLLGLNILPSDTTGCEQIVLTVDSLYENILWSDAITANSRSFTQSGQYWFTGTDTSSGCPVSDTVTINLLNTSNLQILPNDTLVCEGPPLTLNAYNAQAIAYQWSTGSSDSVITVFTPGTYWVNLFFAGNCSLRDSIVVNFSEDIEPLAEDEFTFCDGEPVEFNLDPQKFITATWSNSQTGLQATYSSAGRYWVRAQKLDGCLVSDTFALKPSLNFDTAKVFNDTTFCAGDFIRFKAPLEYEVKWPNGSDTTYYVSVPQSIKVTISDGCTTLDQFFDVRQINCECDVIMPNAFTPNGDGLNDIYGPVAECDYLVYELFIFNRWGMQVFYTQSPGVGFDGTLNGKELPGGTFIYKFNFNNGINEGTRTGTLVLIR